MFGWWLSGLVVVMFNMTVVNSKVDLVSQVRLAQCRAACLHQVHRENLTDSRCAACEECSQCWSSCSLLLGNLNNRLHCSRSFCNRGCRAACRFKFTAPLRNLTTSLSWHEEVLTVSDSRVSWPSQHDATRDGGPVVYVVLPAALQTLDLHASVPVGGGWTTRVLVVDWRGLLKVLSPPSESPLHRVRAILRSLGLDLTPQRRLEDKNNTINYKQIAKNNTITRPWRLRKVSMVLQSSVVLAQISWETQEFPDNHNSSLTTYLVTWEVEGGVIRGNLLTNSTSVTLSLWPDTFYKIQVSIVDPEELSSFQSEPLLLDTRHLREETPSTRHLTHQGTDTQELLVATAVVLLLLVTLATTWRWHHRLSLPHSKLVDEDVGTPNIYRVFPPAVRLISEKKIHSPDIFSSTDNLLQNH